MKQNLSNVGSLYLGFQKQKHKYRATCDKSIKAATQAQVSSHSDLSLACPYTFVGSEPILQVSDNESQGKSEIFNTTT